MKRKAPNANRVRLFRGVSLCLHVVRNPVEEIRAISFVLIKLY